MSIGVEENSLYAVWQMQVVINGVHKDCARDMEGGVSKLLAQVSFHAFVEVPSL